MRVRCPLGAAALAALLALATLLTGVAGASAHGRLPGLLWHDGGRANAFLVRPASVYTTEDGSGVFGVLHHNGSETEHGPGRGFLRWTRWTSRSARAVGTQWTKFGTPTATSPFTRGALVLDAYRVRDHHFTRLGFVLRHDGRSTHVTLCLSPPFHGGYTWDEIYHGRCM